MATTETYRPPATIALRILLTVVGAAGLIIGAFLDWLADGGKVKGTKIKYNVFYASSTDLTNKFLLTAGFVMIVIALMALLGLGLRTGALTRLAGALGIVAVVMFGVNVY